MDITEVKVILKEGPDKKLKAYATITIDNCFVVRNVKIINGNKGLFVAMPSRKMRESCKKCNHKNAIRSRFCNQCGSALPVSGLKDVNQEIRQSEHRDIAHPITLECREYIQKKVLNAYEAELKRSTRQSDKPSYSVPIEAETNVPPKAVELPKESVNSPEDVGDIAL